MSSRRQWLLGLVGISFLLVAGQARPAGAGDTTYNPISDTTQQVAQGAISQPFTFTATSPVLPATGRPKMTPYQSMTCPSDGSGVLAEFLAKDLTYTNPDTLITEPFDFSAWITIVPASHCYPGPSLGPVVAVTIDVPEDAALGQYGAKLVAKGPNGIGWGEGAGVHITFTVIAPTDTDTTPPIVTIIEPALDSGQPQKFILGNRVPVDFTAIDEESAVTAWTADLLPGSVDISSLLTESAITNGIEAEGYILTAVPGGSETIQAIGQYTLQVTATSEGGTSAPATRDFSVNYNINPLAPDLNQTPPIFDKSVAGCSSPPIANGKKLQVKFEARAVQPADTESVDNSGEAFVKDTTVRVAIENGSGTELSSRVAGSDNDTTVVITGITGAAVPGPNYFTRYDFCGLANGTDYKIKIYFHDHSGSDFLQFSKTFTVQD